MQNRHEYYGKCIAYRLIVMYNFPIVSDDGDTFFLSKYGNNIDIQYTA